MENGEVANGESEQAPLSDKADDSRNRWGVGRLAALLCIVASAAFLSIGQAITFTWLSALPEQAARLESLEWKFWIYAALSVVLVLVAINLVWLILRRTIRRDKQRVSQS